MTARAPLPEIHLSSLAYTVGHWLVHEDRPDHFDLDAPYQRGSVWTLDQRRALIQSLYMGLPVGAVIVAKLPFRDGSPIAYRVVDGKQRIEAVRAFAAGGFDVPGWWFRDGDVDRVSPDGTVGWDDLSRPCRLNFDMRMQLPALEFDSEHEYLGRDDAGRARWRKRTDEEMLRAEAALYLLVNGGGAAQTAEDLARAAEVAR